MDVASMNKRSSDDPLPHEALLEFANEPATERQPEEMRSFVALNGLLFDPSIESADAAHLRRIHRARG